MGSEMCIRDRNVTAPNLGTSAWTVFTPSFTNLTVGNGTSKGHYTQDGKTVRVITSFSMGSTSVMGDLYLVLPVADGMGTYSSNTIIGSLGLRRSSTNSRPAGSAFLLSGGANLVTSDGAVLSPTAPWAWAVGDSFTVCITYEAA